MPSLWIQFWSFYSSKFYCLTYWNFKKRRKEEDIKREIKEEGIKQERRKERKEELKEKKSKELLKKKKPSAGFKLAKPVLLVFLAAAGGGEIGFTFLLS